MATRKRTTKKPAKPAKKAAKKRAPKQPPITRDEVVRLIRQETAHVGVVRVMRAVAPKPDISSIVAGVEPERRSLGYVEDDPRSDAVRYAGMQPDRGAMKQVGEASEKVFIGGSTVGKSLGPSDFTSPVPPVEPSPFDMLSVLAAAQQAVFMQLDELATKLGPILRPANVKDTPLDAASRSRGPTDLTSSISFRIEDTESLSRQLGELIRRIHL